MNSRVKMLNVTKLVSSIVFFLGMIVFIYGYENGFIYAVGIGLGTVAGAILIFLMGMFFIATEEMVENTFKGIKITPLKPRKGAPL